MPELPEIETICRKLKPKLIKQKLLNLTLRRPDLRIPIPKNLKNDFENHLVTNVRRRSKYILIDFEHGQSLIIHLGMSGRFFFTEAQSILDKHDHVLFDFSKNKHLRLRDPRRFGILSAGVTRDLIKHPLFSHLGVEPLEESFTGDYLFQLAKKSKAPIKSLLMNASHIVGVGNIYANEALFLAKIKPTLLSCQLTKKKADVLVTYIKKSLTQSIASGGTTFRDYVGADQKPGLHQLSLFVYGRAGLPCLVCKTSISRLVQSNRSSFYCSNCQKSGKQ